MPAYAAILSSLKGFPQQLEDCFRLFPSSMHHWRPQSWEGIPSERLTALEQVCHVRDIERDGYHGRIRRTLAEETPALADIPGEALAIERRYFEANAAEVLADFRAARAETLSLVAGLSTPQLRRVALFEGQPVALHNLLHFLCSHDSQHLAGLHWLLGKMNWELRS